MGTSDNRRVRWRRYWDNHAPSYDRTMAFADRHFFGDTRSWVCSQAHGEVLEVAIGTGLNIPEYPGNVSLTGIEQSEPMLDLARQRSAELGRPVTLMQADAHELPFEPAAFDTVVCTFSLCAIPDHQRAISEMIRVLRPGGSLLLADHIGSNVWPVRAVQWLADRITIPLGGEHFQRRPLAHVRAAGLAVEDVQRFKFGIVERLKARQPSE